LLLSDLSVAEEESYFTALYRQHFHSCKDPNSLVFAIMNIHSTKAY